MAYFYFDFGDSEKQRSENLIRSLITQLSFQTSSCPDSLAALYSQNQNGQRHPTIQSLMMTLKDIVRGFERVYMILDALDECDEDRKSVV